MSVCEMHVYKCSFLSVFLFIYIYVMFNLLHIHLLYAPTHREGFYFFLNECRLYCYYIYVI